MTSAPFPASPAVTTLAATAPDMLTAVMLVDIGIVLVVGVLLARLMRRLRQPGVIGEVLAGIALGPSLLGALPGNLSDKVFPVDVRPLLNGVSQVGLVLFMFLVGWEFERRLVRPHARLAAVTSLSSIAVAFGLGVALATWLYPQHAEVAGHHIGFAPFAVFLGTAMSVTAFPVLARILADNRLMDTRVGSLALASAAIDDVLAWCLLAYVSASVTADGDYAKLGRIAGWGLVYVAAMLLAVRPLLARLVWRWSGAERWPALLAVLCAGAFTSAWLTSWIGVHAIFGAFLFGFIAPREPAPLLATHLRKPLENISVVLLPVFFVVTGLGVDFGGLTGRDVLALCLIIAVACAGKLVGAVVPARLSGMSWRESKDLGLLMNTRGLTELIILNAAVTLGVLDERLFTMMVIMAIVTTVMAAPLLSRREVLVAQTPARAKADVAGS
jgi:Kef-type K+ transport system membrane component KefB